MPKMSRDHTIGKTREAQAQDRTAAAVATQHEAVQGEQQKADRSDERQQDQRQDDAHDRREDQQRDDAAIQANEERQAEDRDRTRDERHDEDKHNDQDQSNDQDQRNEQDQRNDQDEGWGKVLPYNEQARALYDEAGKRQSENEHVIPNGNLKAITTNPETGDADYTRSQYRNDDTVRVERDFALEKTAGNPESDNARTARMKEALENGEGLNYREMMEDAIDNAKAARDRSGSVVSDEAIHRGALGQDANMFGLQRLEESGRKVKETGSLIEDFDIRESADESRQHEEEERRASEERVRRQRDEAQTFDEALKQWEEEERT